jgi:signal transduction histidine kinase
MMKNNTAEGFTMGEDSPDDLSVSANIGHLLVENMGRGVIFVNYDGLITSMNRSATEILLVEKENVIGKRVDMLPLRTPIYKVLSEPCRTIPLEMVVRGRVVAVQTTEIKTDDGVVQGDMTELWDVTEERRAKRQWEEFLAMMAHDLRSPLTMIMVHIQGMQIGMYGEVGKQLRSAMEKVERSGAKLHSMIEEMLDNYRLDVGLLNLDRKSVDICDILEVCFCDNQRDAQEQGVKLLFEKKDGLPEVRADARQLTRVFNNLIGNAIKYTLTDGEVHVMAEAAENAIKVTVSDTGIGVPAEDHSRIFFKYYRSPGASGIKGTGLGLAISKAIIEAHGGSIEVESSLGAGSRFMVVLPFVAPDDGDSVPP